MRRSGAVPCLDGCVGFSGYLRFLLEFDYLDGMPTSGRIP